ncbi:uroporphyrinogen-III synthase [Roseovarius amoyensis]|uniref:uroporphyrinogen-III synthase n=1 Tax=Roseovarius amoyensis TaxID=2211448 RepID=UPI000DBE552D|nr:uroporphyrinogen-III synthase [Roseovarius amoyensis]
MAFSILITRPEPAAVDFAAKLRARLGAGVQIVTSPILRIERVAGALPDLSRTGTLVLTSVHAVSALADLPQVMRPVCYCVGATTAAAARAAGFAAVDGGGDARALLARILADRPHGPIHYLRGEHVAANLVAELSAAGYETDETVVYRQRQQPLNAKAKALLSGDAPVILPLFSPRSAALLFEAASHGAPLHIAAISRNAADRVPPDRAAQLIVTDAPTAEAMLAATLALVDAVKRVETGTGSK